MTESIPDNPTQEIDNQPPLSLWTRWGLVLSVVFVLSIMCSGCVTLLYFGGVNAVRSHPAYKPVVDRLNADPRVEAALGKPLEVGLLGNDAKVNVGKTEGFARYTLPVTGPKGSATVMVHTIMKDNQWNFLEISIQFAGKNDLLDLLETSTETPK